MNPKLSNSKVVFQAIKSQLTLDDPDEVHAIALAIFEKQYGLTLTEILSEKEVISFDLSNIILRINQHEPLQYVLGEADFFGRKFKVNSSVLIPRPETELLINEILKLEPPAPRILDIGAGSGCIAITLKLEIPEAQVTAIDVSDAALSVAGENMKLLNAVVKFVHADFKKNFFDNPFDIIVSNPPYVRESEKETMHKNVLEHEPHLALFVPDNDPLVFYRVIAEQSKILLNPNGQVFVEVNEHFGQEVRALFMNSGFKDGHIIKDLDGKDRIVSAKRTS